MELDLFNVKSVRLAESTKVKLFLPGLGTGLWEEEESTKPGTQNSEASKKAKKRLAKMRNACADQNEDGIVCIIEEKQPDEEQESDEDSDDEEEVVLPSFLLNMASSLNLAPAPEPAKKKKPVDKWLVNKKDPWAKQSGRNAPIMGQNSPWSDMNSGLDDATASYPSGGGAAGNNGAGGSSLTQGPERSAKSSAAVLATSGNSSSSGLPLNPTPKGNLSSAASMTAGASSSSSSQAPASRVPVWERVTAASQSKSQAPTSPHHSEPQPRVLKAVQAKTVSLGFGWGQGASPLVVASDPNGDSPGLLGIYDTGQWASSGSGGGRETSPSRQARLQSQRFGSPGSVAASLSRRRANSNSSLNPPGTSRPPHPSPSASSLSSAPQGPAVAAMASLFQASIGMLQAASGSDGETSKRHGSREGGSVTPRGGASDRDSIPLVHVGAASGSGTLPILPMHQLQLTDPGGDWRESSPRDRPFTTNSSTGASFNVNQRASTAAPAPPMSAAGQGSSPAVKLTSALYSSRVASGPSNSPSRR